MIRPLLFPTEIPIATKRNTFAKRQREQDKKQRADQKRTKRDQKAKEPTDPSQPTEGQPADFGIIEPTNRPSA